MQKSLRRFNTLLRNSVKTPHVRPCQVQFQITVQIQIMVFISGPVSVYSKTRKYLPQLTIHCLISAICRSIQPLVLRSGSPRPSVESKSDHQLNLPASTCRRHSPNQMLSVWRFAWRGCLYCVPCVLQVGKLYPRLACPICAFGEVVVLICKSLF